MLQEITIIAFNFGIAGKHVNGPGLCLYNLCNFLRQGRPDIKINIFTQLNCQNFDLSWDINLISDDQKLKECIKKSSLVHHWSGLGTVFKEAIDFAKSLKKLVILGPNLIDCVNLEQEREFLNNLKYDLLFTVNKRLRFLISKTHNVDIEKIRLLMVGPDQDLWKPADRKERTILWKGNSQHFVKDVQFGLEVAKRLPQYNFKFLGHPKPYEYFEHINEAKSCYLYFSTSLSETMGLSILEAWSSSIPTITHPQVYLHGINYQTGIITNRDIKSYCQAIEEIMEDEQLYTRLSWGAHDYARIEFDKYNIVGKYLNQVATICM